MLSFCTEITCHPPWIIYCQKLDSVRYVPDSIGTVKLWYCVKQRVVTADIWPFAVNPWTLDYRFGVKKLEISPYHVVCNILQFTVSFMCGLSVWQTDRQTDRWMDRTVIAIVCNLCHGNMWNKLFQPSSMADWSNFISARGNSVETCLKLFQSYFRGLLQLMNILQHVQCWWNNFSVSNNFISVSDMVACEIEHWNNFKIISKWFYFSVTML